MRTLPALTLLLTLLAPAPAVAQNLLTNGDFSNGLTGWSTAGVGTSPQVESFDVDGFGASSCFGISPGPPNTTNPPHDFRLTQQVPVSSSAHYLARLDVVLDAPGFNNDAGTVLIKLGGTQVTAIAFGQVTSRVVIRDVLCARFRPTSSGLLTFEVNLSRPFRSALGRTPRIRIDNVRLEPTAGPVFCIAGTRQPATSSSWEVDGRPNAAYAVLVAPRLGPGFQVPPVRGTLHLDPATMVVALSGRLDNGGIAKGILPFPNDPTLAGVPLYFQPVMADIVAIDLGPADNFGLRQ